MSDFSISMRNHWSIFPCDRPNEPTQVMPDETLHVERVGDILKIAAVDEATCSVEARIYGKFVKTEKGQEEFKLLDKLPHKMVDARFFAATGTAFMFDEGGKRRLRASGTDTHNGRCGGWIFNATEI